MDINNVFIIPTTSDPNQKFKCTISIDGNNKSFIFNLSYNSMAKYWLMTLTDPTTNEIIIDSIPLVTGNYPSANLLEQYSYLKIGSAAIIKVDPDITDENPNDENLGTGFKLVWSDTL